jgi:hypothetical protein
MSYVDVFDQCANVVQMARGCPVPTLRRAYVTTMRDWCAQTQWLRVNVTGATVADQALYDLGSDNYIEIIGLYAMSGQDNTFTPPQQWPIGPSDPANWNPALNTNRPLRYAYVPEGQMALNPTPDGVYGITYTAIVQPKEGVTQIPSEPLKKYSTGIEAGALAYLLAMKDTPWFNPQEAASQTRVYGAYISNGKAEVARKFNTGSQRAAARPFGVARNAFNRLGY